jgi:hypothetical protein
MLLGFEIGQRWPEVVMHSCGSYFIPIPQCSVKLSHLDYLFLYVLKNLWQLKGCRGGILAA